MFSLIVIIALFTDISNHVAIWHYSMQVAVHLWVSSEGVLSSCSFRIIQSIAVVFSSEYFDICLIRTYKAYIGHSKVVDVINAKHMEFLRNSFVEICFSDVHKSCTKALLSIQQLAKILKQGLVTKKKVCSKLSCCLFHWIKTLSCCFLGRIRCS